MSGLRRIVDAHHHLWDLDACHYPWLMATGVKRFFGDPAPIRKNYLVPDLRADAAGYELAGSVHVQVGVAEGSELAETRWLEGTAAAEGLPSAIVAYCDLGSEDAAACLDAHRAYPHVRGIRQIVGRSADEDAATGSGRLLDSRRWREGLARAAELGLSFDLQLTPPQMARAAEVIAAVPGLRVALCHCGSPWEQSGAGFAQWRRGLGLLAGLPDVYCKISGLGMFDHDWTEDSIRPIVETCIDTFGAGRCMFGSNFPVDKLHANYAQVWGAFERITAGLGDAENERLFGATAAAFYRL